jgi:ADP-heptose:LPS heptosyltransferase
MNAPPRILLLRPDHLGDVLLTLPMAQLLRRSIPDGHITVAAPPGLVSIATRCPAVNDVLGVDFPPPTASDFPDGWTEGARAVAAGMRDRFDIALIPRMDDPWSGHLAELAAIPRRMGFGHPRTRRFLTDALPLPERCHVVELGLAVARHVIAAGEPGLEPDAWISPRAEDDAEADRVLSSLPADPHRAQAAIVAFHPGSSWKLKEWPASRWGSLIQRLSERYRISSLVTGSEHERALVANVVAASAGHATGLAGRLSLGGLAALYHRAALVIAVDSGPLHLAVATGTRAVGIYGPADPLEFGPWSRPGSARLVRTALPCQPCRRLDGPPCGALERPACLRGVGVGDVLDSVEDMLGARSVVRAEGEVVDLWEQQAG